MDGTSDQAASNWGNVYIPADPNDAPLARSNFDPGHRITLTARYDMPFGRELKPTVSMFYSAQSGRPYTLTTSVTSMATTAARTTCCNPASPTSCLLTPGGTYDDSSASHQRRRACAVRRQIIPRNACRAPWTNTLDGRFAMQLPFERVKAEITLDTLNLINLINSENGLFQYMSFGPLRLYAPIASANRRSRRRTADRLQHRRHHGADVPQVPA